MQCPEVAAVFFLFLMMLLWISIALGMYLATGSPLWTLLFVLVSCWPSLHQPVVYY